MNKVIITGNLARDPEARTTQSGISQSSFTVAVQRAYSKEHEADFLNCVAWRQSADFVNTYLKKGDKVAVEGSVQVRSYDAKDGQKRYVTEIIADRVESLTSKRDSEQAGEQADDGLVETEEDELPF